MRRQNRGHADKVLLLDVGVAQGELERCQLIAMNADALGQEKADWNREHALAQKLEW
jgi:hypothetical protein